MIGLNHALFAHHVEIRILEAGEGLFAGVLARSGGAYCHGHVGFARFLADVAIGLTHGFVHGLGNFHGKNGGLDQHRTFTELVDHFLGGGETLHYIVYEGAQADTGGVGLGGVGGADFLTQVADQLLHEFRVLVDFRIIPVDARVFFFHQRAYQGGVDGGFVQQLVEADG